jgi:nitroimidazol reductase NimA-like FMN-containing flavoprotein (pyridoxamine 5'-phosphate oxidase superfamily)/predicted GIY-YIG superfamily endonuclease
MNYVYILECKDGTFYTGYTNNLNKRIKVHNDGKGAKYTRGRLPVKLVYLEEITTKSEALKREYAIKRLKRKDKIILINKIEKEEFTMRDMRKTERKMDNSKALEILREGEYCILSTCGEDNQPYGVPVSYVLIDDNVYFHCANVGSKLDNIYYNNKVCITVVPYTELMPEKFSTKYESVVVIGKAYEISEEEKVEPLMEFLKKYSPKFLKEGQEYINRAKSKVTLIKISIESISGKERF